MLELKNITIKVNQKPLIEDLTLILHPGDKLAIIGEEGNGKSTLLKCIKDKEAVGYAESEGTIRLTGTIGYFAQVFTLEEESQIVREFLKVSTAYDHKTKELYQSLKKFSLEESLLDKRISCLSGGEKVKIRLLHVLLENPDILLLDEPSNDLDIETLEWLENFILEEDRPIMYISHDETLLEKTANRILHIEQVQKKQQARHTLSNVDYATYVEARQRGLAHQTMIARKEKDQMREKEQKLKQVMQKVEHQQNTISRADPHGGYVLKKKMKTLKAQERRMDETELTQVPDTEESIHLYFEEVKIPSQKEIVKIVIAPLTVGEKILSKKVELFVKGKEHIVIIGKNGSGKTTLMRKIAEVMRNRKDIRVGYMSQTYDDVLPDDISPIDYLCPTKIKEEISLARSYLGNSNFTKEEMVNPIKFLSSGTKVKLLFLHFILQKCDVLLLDEPTRNLSPLSNPVIRQVLKDFTGSIISISHDRKYLQEVGETIYELTMDGLHQIRKEL